MNCFRFANDTQSIGWNGAQFVRVKSGLHASNQNAYHLIASMHTMDKVDCTTICSYGFGHNWITSDMTDWNRGKLKRITCDLFSSAFGRRQNRKRENSYLHPLTFFERFRSNSFPLVSRCGIFVSTGSMLSLLPVPFSCRSSESQSIRRFLPCGCIWFTSIAVPCITTSRDNRQNTHRIKHMMMDSKIKIVSISLALEMSKIWEVEFNKLRFW